ncbi:MAG: DUF1549 domain-containing protein [Planctomycetota bacterium]|nr:DUF1549 domain-containing protein [Planctomycetota bacterium]
MNRTPLRTALVVFSLLSICTLCETASGQARPGSQKGGAKKSGQKKPAKPKLPGSDPAHRKKITIQPVKANTLSSVLESAAKIDSLVANHLRGKGLKANPPIPDSVFVRRVYLDITGTIPTAKQAALFVSSKDGNKRQKLIDQLLNSPGYASHQYNYWANVMRVVDQPNGNIYIRPYSEWLKKNFRQNVPFDVWVRQMMTAEGKAWENPATGYFLRDSGMPLDNLSNTTRIFLGTQIGCAQCHDHPFDTWSQKDFYELAAFFGGLQTRDYRKGTSVPDLESKKEEDEIYTMRRLVRINRSKVWDNEKKYLKYPKDYAYENAKPGQVVKTGVLFGKTDIAKGAKRRVAFANWLTTGNERFATTVANRMWKRAFGIGLIEPLDDMNDQTDAAIPELMTYLAAEMKRLKYDLKEFQRILFNTKIYQRESTFKPLNPTADYDFTGPVLRRMTAEQVWDSLLTLTIARPDELVRPDDSSYIASINIKPGTTADSLLQQAVEHTEVTKADRALEREYMYKGRVLRRASEMKQPLPDSHFLRQFGQSDRKIVENSTEEGTVPQLLALFNGPVTHMMLEEGSVIYDDLVAANDKRKIDLIFYSLLSRAPSSTERATATKEIRESGRAGYGNVIWALLNTREFLFIQ